MDGWIRMVLNDSSRSKDTYRTIHELAIQRCCNLCRRKTRFRVDATGAMIIVVLDVLDCSGNIQAASLSLCDKPLRPNSIPRGWGWGINY